MLHISYSRFEYEYSLIGLYEFRFMKPFLFLGVCWFALIPGINQYQAKSLFGEAVSIG